MEFGAYFKDIEIFYDAHKGAIAIFGFIVALFTLYFTLPFFQKKGIKKI